MKLSTDHAFRIGSMHLRGGMPCQDYATSGEAHDGAYAIVSDGCSGGGETDVGARLNALAMASWYRRWIGMNVDLEGNEMMSRGVCTIERNADARAAEAASMLSLGTNDMLSTMVHACVIPDVGVTVRVLGDGAYALVMRDGNVLASRVEWNGSMPAYPAYRDDDYAAFYRAHGGADALACTVTSRTTWDEGEACMASSTLTAGEAARGLTASFDAAYLRNVQTVAVFSDGVGQCGDDWYDVVRDLLRLSGEGHAVRRRMHGFVRRRGGATAPQDDIAMAAIRIAHEENE